MISIRKNPNFSNWFQVFAFGKMIDEFTRKAKAIHLANDIARNTEQTHIVVEGRAVQAQ
jgi:hypothetical protein